MIHKRALVLAVLLVSACTRPSEPSLSLPDPSLLDDSETVRIQVMRDESAHLIAVKDYDGLEKLAAMDRAMESFLGSGMAPISSFYEGVAGVPSSDAAAGERRLNALNAWCTACPNSVTARIALAFAITKDAWFARGGGYADTVSQGGWSTFDEKLKKVSEVLNRVADKRQAYPEWYVATNSVSQGLGEDKATFLARNFEGTTFYPKMIEIYGGPLVVLLPRWSGSNKEVLDYATQSADRVGGDEGDILYARMAKRVWDYSDDTNVFTEVGFSWPRVRRGMELTLSRYPHSKNIANEFCVFAYQVRDHATAHILFSYLGDRYMEFPWASLNDYQAAQAWAK